VDRAKKREVVAMLREVFRDTPAVVVAHNLGLTVAEITDLRNRMYEAGGRVKVAKNRLAKLALKGSPREGLADLLTGPTVLFYSDDPVVAPKIVVEFAKKNEKLVILGGALDASILDADGVKALAELPSLDELRARLIGLVQAPAQKIASVLQAPGGQIARVLAARAEQEQAA
jgi:large subunit ribosomal protein L10